MSGEFGEYGGGGYFHSKIEQCAEDCDGGSAEITRLWGAFLKEFVPVAKSISWCEASDSGEDDPIWTSLDQMSRLKEHLSKIEAYLRPFKDVAEQAVRDALRNKP